MPKLQLSSGIQWGLYFCFSVVYGSLFYDIFGSSIKKSFEREKENFCLNKTFTGNSKHVEQKKKKKKKNKKANEI